MEALKLIITIIQVISSVVLITVVVLQDGKQAGLSGVIGGGSTETFFARNKAKSSKAKLANATKWVAIAFFVLSLALNILLAAM